jgi:uncharacterized protein YceK
MKNKVKVLADYRYYSVNNETCHRKVFFVKAISILMILVLSGCSTMMTVNAVDQDGRLVNDATVLVDGKKIGTTPNATKKVSNAVWKTPIIMVTKQGFYPIIKEADKEFKMGPAIAGVLLICPLWLYVWGPRPHQLITLTPDS